MIFLRGFTAKAERLSIPLGATINLPEAWAAMMGLIMLENMLFRYILSGLMAAITDLTFLFDMVHGE
jgi:hypothetical protein